MSHNFDYDDEEHGEEDQAAQEADLLNKVRKIKTIAINAKCDDRCEVIAMDENGAELARRIDNPPHGLGVGGGDYIKLQIDIETGRILNWKKPDDADLVDAFDR